MTRVRVSTGSVLIGMVVLALSSLAWSQHIGDAGKPESGHHAGTEHPKMEAQAPPIRVTMETLHQHGGVPPGWHFLMPPGDPTEGRTVFVAMRCFTCHEVKGERFPDAPRQPGDVGPELTGMGRFHAAEYMAESILNPNRVIVEGPGYTGPDGLSKMPDYSDTMTLRQLIDLVAYLKSLTGGAPDRGGEHGGSAH